MLRPGARGGAGGALAPPPTIRALEARMPGMHDPIKPGRPTPAQLRDRMEARLSYKISMKR